MGELGTTEQQIEEMKGVCLALKANPLIEDAWLDDWGRFGNFDLRVKPKVHERSSTVRILAGVRKLLPRGARIRECFAPQPVREWLPDFRKYKHRGFDRNYWSLDVDFHHYDPRSNLFS